MKSFSFTSSLANEMAHFVKLKQHSGSDYYSPAKLLFQFDRYLDAVSFRGKVLSKLVFQDYFAGLDHLNSRTFSNHLGVLRQFSTWLNRHGTVSHIPEKHPAAYGSKPWRAYIFNSDEIRTILAKSAEFTRREERFYGLYQTLFGLLYSTGIRIGEALALTYADYIEDEKLLHIRQGKFKKERYVVLSNSAASRLNEHIRRYQTQMLLKAESSLFVNIHGKPLIRDSAHLAFVKTLNKSGITRGTGGPRLHDFRHTFAVHRLLQWYQAESDINAKLPLLSTYMGHVDITSTQLYLEATDELLQAGCERFHKYYTQHTK